MQPLNHIRVLDLTRLLPGGICSLLLADMGADVIKVEDPKGGDYARWMPPLVKGVGAFFRASNRNKQSIIVNLKDPAGQQVLHDLVKEADVLIEGFRPGVMQRLNCGYDTLKAINPKLVYCALSGWGQGGPYAEVGGHDLNYVALGGLQGGMQTPQPLGGQVADVGGAYVGVMGILAALLTAERTGTGDFVDVALFESALPFAYYQIVEATVAKTSGGEGGLTGGLAYYDVFTSSDGQPMTFGAIEMKFFKNFCEAVERPDWIERHTAPDQAALKREIQDLFATKTAADWQAILDEVDCCFTLVTPPQNVIDDPQVQARGMMSLGEDGVPYMRSPIRLSENDEFSVGDVPDYGEHTRAVLQSIGYDDAKIDLLVEAGAISKKS